MAFIEQRVEESPAVGTSLRTGPSERPGAAPRPTKRWRTVPSRSSSPPRSSSQPEGPTFQPGPAGGSSGEQEAPSGTPGAPQPGSYQAQRERARQTARETADGMWAWSRGRLSSAQFAKARGAVGDVLEVSDRMAAIRRGGFSSALRYALGEPAMDSYTASLYRANALRRPRDNHPGHLIPGGW
jgi:hypothetical protein